MTVGVSIKCSDGIVIACDSLTTFSRGSPVKRYTNKAYTITHNDLLFPVVASGAGMTAFIDKFVDIANREAIADAAKEVKRPLDIVDFCSEVCEPLAATLFKKYYIERNQFFGGPFADFSLFLIVAGATKDKELRSFFVHQDGLTENIPDYGTIGSGAAYAELFLNALLSDSKQINTCEAAQLSVYAIKGVEIMDPNVGGKTNVMILKMKNEKLEIEAYPSDEISDKAMQSMKVVLGKMSSAMREHIKLEQP